MGRPKRLVLPSSVLGKNTKIRYMMEFINFIKNKLKIDYSEKQSPIEDETEYEHDNDNWQEDTLFLVQRFLRSILDIQECQKLEQIFFKFLYCRTAYRNDFQESWFSFKSDGEIEETIGLFNTQSISLRKINEFLNEEEVPLKTKQIKKNKKSE